MQLGLMVEPQAGGTYKRLVELARWAENNGLESFARSDHYLDGTRSAPATEAMTSIAGIARETSTVELVVLVSPLTFRHPAVIAKEGATIDEMSGGRFALGIGTGWMESEHEAFGLELPDLRERFSRLFETLAYVRAAFDGEAGYRGRHYELKPTDVLPKPVGISIVVGGQGMKKTPTLAGRFADEYNMFSTDHATLDERLEVMRSAAVANDRDPDAITVSIASPMLVGATEERFDEIVAARAERTDQTPDEVRASLKKRNILHGTPDEAAEIAASLEAMGVQKLYLQRYEPLEKIDLELIGATVAAIRSRLQEPPR